jgi:hypothetical protein
MATLIYQTGGVEFKLEAVKRLRQGDQDKHSYVLSILSVNNRFEFLRFPSDSKLPEIDAANKNFSPRNIPDSRAVGIPQ